MSPAGASFLFSGAHELVTIALLPGASLLSSGASFCAPRAPVFGFTTSASFLVPVASVSVVGASVLVFGAPFLTTGASLLMPGASLLMPDLLLGASLSISDFNMVYNSLLTKNKLLKIEI
ncbi:MAG: hypothetical protein Q8765_02570 [Sweet potato little leaf phytoplasma]|nr:hypothetical protein [Sweet potato little leaf phytoplasma]